VPRCCGGRDVVDRRSPLPVHKRRRDGGDPLLLLESRLEARESRIARSRLERLELLLVLRVRCLLFALARRLPLLGGLLLCLLLLLGVLVLEVVLLLLVGLRGLVELDRDQERAGRAGSEALGEQVVGLTRRRVLGQSAGVRLPEVQI